MITSKSNQYLKLYSELMKKKYRHEYGLFPAEGKRLIEDFVDCGMNPHLILYEENFTDIGFLEKVCSKSDISFMVANDIFKRLTDTVSGQGIVGVFPMICPDLSAFQPKEGDLIFILNQLQDPGNLGAMIRNSAAAGIAALILEEGTVDLYNPKVVRATMGALSKIPVFDQVSMTDIQNFIARKKVNVYLSDMKGELPYWDLPMQETLAVVFGNEGNGLSQGWRNENYKKVYIPQKNDIESLNVSMAGGIIAFDFLRKSLK